jgi:hypothetical protein
VTDEKVLFMEGFSPEEEKKIMRRVDWRILPIIGLMSLIKAVFQMNAMLYIPWF